MVIIIKRIIAFLFIFSAVSLFGPMIVSGGSKEQKTIKTEAFVSVGKTERQEINKLPVFRVKLKDGTIEDISTEDYLLGCMAGEMPVNFNDEALKAQCIAAYTFAKRKKELSNGDYDITADYNIDQCYLTEEEMKKKWGDDYEKNKERITKIIKEVKGQWLSFDGKPAMTVYHAISCGVSYSAKEVWGSDISYLKSVDSSFDKTAAGYSSVKEYTDKEFAEKIKDVAKAATPFNIKITDKSAVGRVKNLEINGTKVSGSAVVKALGLRSQNFTVKTEDDKVVFTVYGYGHGVGMSQNGAQYLAQNGSGYKEILNHYYSGTKLKSE